MAESPNYSVVFVFNSDRSGSRTGPSTIKYNMGCRFWSVGLVAPSGATYGCAYLPTLNLTDNTARFSNSVFNDAYPSATSASTKYMTINGVLDLPTTTF